VSLYPFKSKPVLRIRSYAKINLHLEILGIRDDNFHELSMVMQSVDLADNISFFKSSSEKINLETNNKKLSNYKDNLIVKAANILKEASGQNDLGVNIYLEKNIPIGAGLAGGSSNAASTLKALNILWELEYDDNLLFKFASELGSDVPFCLKGGTKFCFGRGEIVENINSGLKEYGVILIKDPNESISTPSAYNLYKKKYYSQYLKDVSDINNKRTELRSCEWIVNFNNSKFPLRNDLQTVIVPINESVSKALSLLSQVNNVINYSMSGSGPTCFALFDDYQIAKDEFLRNKNIFKENGFDSWCSNFVCMGNSIY